MFSVWFVAIPVVIKLDKTNNINEYTTSPSDNNLVQYIVWILLQNVELVETIEKHKNLIAEN